MTTQPPPPSRLSLGLAIAALAGVLTVLIAGLPYATGYGEARTTILAYTTNLWKLDEWQHCWMVLPICAYLVWSKRDELAQLPVRGALSGALPLALGLGLYWVGYRVDNYFIGLGGLMLVLAGGILWFFGWRWMRSLAFPWAFLFFAMPLLFLESMLAFRLRLLMSDVSVVLLNLVGVPTVQEGTAILSAANPLIHVAKGTQFSVDVADPCSGIRSLFALTMVTALYAYFVIRPLWKQWLLFACSIALAIAGNVARILMLTFGTLAFGAPFAIGSLEHPSVFHMIAGYLVFIVALGGLLIAGNLLMLDWLEVRHTLRRALTQLPGVFARKPSSPPAGPIRPDAPARENAPARLEDAY